MLVLPAARRQTQDRTLTSDEQFMELLREEDGRLRPVDRVTNARAEFGAIGADRSVREDEAEARGGPVAAPFAGAGARRYRRGICPR